MKKVGRYILVFVIFVLLMSFIFVYFTFRKQQNRLMNNGRELLNYLSKLNEGEYSFKKGLIYTSSGSLVDQKYFFDGNGSISIDKYGNVGFKINSNKNCVYKNKAGNVEADKTCPSNDELKVEIVKNNDVVSFITNRDNVSYKLSKLDNFSGNWTPANGKNVVLTSYYSGDNYIWFKDENGVLSQTYTFNLECLNSNGDNYDKSVYYCMGSKVKLDNKEWLVLESKSNYTTLMLADSLIDRLNMCTNTASKYCFYTRNMDNSYKWSLSYVNYYLNNIFIKELSEDTVSKLISREICDVYSDSGCDDDKGCGGYLKEEITLHKYTCDKYSTSKIRIITYEEYNEVHQNVKDMKDFVGNYWILNSYGKDVCSTVEEKGNVYIKEDPTNKKEVRPVITISK